MAAQSRDSPGFGPFFVVSAGVFPDNAAQVKRRAKQGAGTTGFVEPRNNQTKTCSVPDLPRAARRGDQWETEK
jgi:hypothetical protein